MFGPNYEGADYMLAVWQPYEKLRPDEMATHFNKYGKVVNIKDWWRCLGEEWITAFQVVTYKSKDSVKKAEMEMEDNLPNVHALSLMNVLYLAALAELVLSSSAIYLEIKATPQLKVNALAEIVGKLRAFGQIHEIIREESTLKVYYKYATNALAANIMSNGASSHGMRFRTSLINSKTFIKTIKKYLSAYFSMGTLDIELPQSYFCELQNILEAEMESTPAADVDVDEDEEIYIYIDDQHDEDDDQPNDNKEDDLDQTIMDMD
ncbi:uncharacterized protein LOC118183198 [Stegodyphus dumicola]|uniref:uncharacterized protein LOC118183198 n=1 Tax=Stegodyphus dumicola TaxID=202533 RepID=UPI0015A99C00|nr:uncharacterized protein LOC118183198 [Stegodyphus dumicola]